MSGAKNRQNKFLSFTAIILYFSAAKLLIHLFTNNQYGFNRDELYFLICGDHLAFGYVDHPPFVPFIARILKLTIGHSLFAVRLLPALAGAAIVFLTGKLVQRFGGGIFAASLACIAVITAPIFLNMNTLFSSNSFEQLVWASCFVVIASYLSKRNPRYLLYAGILIGVGLMVKHSVVFLVVGILISLYFTNHRRLFLNKWFYLSLLIALIIFLPNLIWQLNHDWATFEFLKKAAINRMEEASPVTFLSQQIFSVNPFSFPLWVAGIIFFFGRKGRKFRLFGWIYLVVFLILALQKSKDYYLAPIYPLLWAAGAVFWEGLIVRLRQFWLKPLSLSVLALSGVILAPLSLPVLSVENAKSYARAFGTDFHPVFMDMIGWEAMVETVASVYNSLPENEKTRCAIMANNYGQASAIDFYGHRYGLPKSISTHNSFWVWGPRDRTGEIIISVGVKEQSLRAAYDDVTLAAMVMNENVVWYETNQPVFIWRNPKIKLESFWPRIKLFY